VSAVVKWHATIKYTGEQYALGEESPQNKTTTEILSKIEFSSEEEW
jgi:hypothetical protein